MDSMPPATTTSDSPSCTAWAARATAFRPEPQTLLMVRAATLGSQPPLRAAWRAGFWPRPACTTLPMMASSICLPSSPARRVASAMALAPSSVAEKPARPPWNLPTGVRTALRITGVSMMAPTSLATTGPQLLQFDVTPVTPLLLVSAAVLLGQRDDAMWCRKKYAQARVPVLPNSGCGYCSSALGP